MPILMPILMPALSPTMSEGKIVRWLKKEGDSVVAGDALVEVETDKATMEVEAVEEGVLGRILVAEGTVVVNTPIALLLHEGEEASILEDITAANVPVPSIAAANRVHATLEPPSTPGGGERMPAATPLARHLAHMHRIDLTDLHGSGPYGRIIKTDIEHAIAAALVPASKPVDAATVGETFEPPHEEVPHTTIRKVIAHRMLESVHNAPHFALTIDFEMDALVELRADLNAYLAAEADARTSTKAGDEKAGDGWRLSINDLLIKACALALRKVPAINASFTEEAMHRYAQINVALAVDTPIGLFTPVIHDADGKGLFTITSEVKKLVHKARAGRLRSEEYSGGTFTLSNLGMFGIRHFSAILNPPQACILAIGAMEPRPVVRQGTLAIATMMTGTLSVDHRAIDGATAAHYLAALKKLIEQPSTMLL